MPGPCPAPRLSAARLLPVALLVLGLAAALLSGAGDLLTLDALKSHAAELRAIAAVPLGVALFMIAYAVVVALSIPGGAVMSLAGGFMFGQWVGTGVVVVSATIGATLLFLAARTGLAEPLRQRAGPWLRRLEAGFATSAFSYLLFLRLVPLFPFFAVNLVPAFLGVSLRIYVLGTLIGILPGSFVLASAGAGLESVIAQGGELTIAGVFTTEVTVALVGLALLSIVPALFQRWRARRIGAADVGRGE